MADSITLASLTLCAEADALSAWVPGMERQVQEVQLARARNARRFDRGNVIVSYAFVVTRRHADLAECETFLDQHTYECARAFGTASIRRGSAPVKTLSEANVVSLQIRQTGQTSVVAYTLRGVLPPELL